MPHYLEKINGIVHRYANVIFLCTIFAVSVYNGASFYIGKIEDELNENEYIHLDVFSRRYIKSLELLQDYDENEGNNSLPRQSISSRKVSHIETDHDAHAQTIDEKKQS